MVLFAMDTVLMIQDLEHQQIQVSQSHILIMSQLLPAPFPLPSVEAHF